MRLIGKSKSSEYIEAPKELSLDDLYAEGQRYGRVEVGGTFHPNEARIKLNFTGDDYISVKSKNAPTVKENLAECIAKARALKQFYGA